MNKNTNFYCKKLYKSKINYFIMNYDNKKISKNIIVFFSNKKIS